MRWMIVAVILAWAGIAGAQIETASFGRLTVAGEGLVAGAPDMATITMGVTQEAKSAEAALAAMTEATAAMLERLASAGIEARDMQTSNLSLQPLWDNSSSGSGQGPRIAGYEASNTVLVRVRALDGLGAVLDAVVKGGANRFHGLSFGLQDPEPAMDDARRAAVADAMRKARLYAEAAGLMLGPVLEMSESGAAAPRPEQMARAALALESVPIAEGEVSVRASVTMVFALTGR